jgi:hypothetical protein
VHHTSSSPTPERRTPTSAAEHGDDASGVTRRPAIDHLDDAFVPDERADDRRHM